MRRGKCDPFVCGHSLAHAAVTRAIFQTPKLLPLYTLPCHFPFVERARVGGWECYCTKVHPLISKIEKKTGGHPHEESTGSQHVIMPLKRGYLEKKQEKSSMRETAHVKNRDPCIIQSVPEKVPIFLTLFLHF